MAGKNLYRDQVVARNEELGLYAAPGQGEARAVDPDTIRITVAAAKEILRQAEKRRASVAAIRLGVRGGGCTGFSYVFDWADGEPREKDHVFREHGVAVYVDGKSFKYLKGMELDFATTMMGYGFKFNNPNAKGACGCGASVQF